MMSYVRRIQVGKQTYLSCSIKSTPCEEENGCIQCNGKYWSVIEKALQPLLMKCSTSLKDKDTIVEFHGTLPCTVDDLHMKVSYDLKPRKSISFVVVQPRSDEKLWEDAWNNASCDHYNNFGGLFEHVRFLDYILHITVSRTEKIWNSSLPSSEKQKDIEEKSSYFQESMTFKSNPLEVLSKRKYGMKRSTKHNQLISNETVSLNTNSSECTNDSVSLTDSSLSANSDVVKTLDETEKRSGFPSSQHKHINEYYEAESLSLNEEKDENQNHLVLSSYKHVGEEPVYQDNSEVISSSLDEGRKETSFQERLPISPYKCVSEELTCKGNIGIRILTLDEDKRMENQNRLLLCEYKHEELLPKDNTEIELSSLDEGERVENQHRLPATPYKHTSEKLYPKDNVIELISDEDKKANSQNKVLGIHKDQNEVPHYMQKHVNGELVCKFNSETELQPSDDRRAKSKKLYSSGKEQFPLCKDNTDDELPSLGEEMENQDKLPPSQCKNMSQKLMHKYDTQVELPSLEVCTQDNIPRTLRRKAKSALTLIDFSSSEDECWLNCAKNIHKSKKRKSSKLKCSSNTKASSQTSMLRNLEQKQNYMSKIPNVRRKKAQKTFNNTEHFSETERKENKELPSTDTSSLTEFLSKDPFKPENGNCADDSSLPKLDTSPIACDKDKGLHQNNVSDKKANSLSVKRKFSRVCSQTTTKKVLSCDKSYEHGANNEHSCSNNSFGKKRNEDQISRLRNLFLDIVSRKKNSDIMESVDIEFLNADFSPIPTDNTTGHIDEINLDDNVERIKDTSLVRSLTKPQLNHIFKKHLSKLKDIYSGKTYCKRYEDFLQGGKTSYELIYQINLSPFKEEQLDYIMELLMSEFSLKPNKDIDYLLKVLLPEALIMIFMEFHGTDYENSDRLMAEATFNKGSVESV